MRFGRWGKRGGLGFVLGRGARWMYLGIGGV